MAGLFAFVDATVVFPIANGATVEGSLEPGLVVGLLASLNLSIVERIMYLIPLITWYLLLFPPAVASGQKRYLAAAAKTCVARPRAKVLPAR
jgi:hypothetical protein